MSKYWQEVAILVHQEASEAVSELLTRYGAQGVAFEGDALIDEIDSASIKVEGYQPHPTIKAPIAV